MIRRGTSRTWASAVAQRAALFGAVLLLCWIIPAASVTLLGGLFVLGMLSELAGELAGQLRVPHVAALALAVFAAAFGAALCAVAGPATGLLGGG
jgi:hypothetical protein